MNAGLALLTDLYELAMGAAYFENDLSEQRASFELFVRKLPRVRSYLVAAGLGQVLDYLRRLRFTAADVAFLERHPLFRHVGRRFFDRLRAFRFSGDLWAMPEGTLAFAGEPLLRVDAPLIEAQLVETFLLSMVNFQTAIASKAARVVDAAAGRAVVEFGTRRAQTPYAGVYGARAAYIGGCAGTSNVAAGRRFGIPTYGTFAHSLPMAFASEMAAFRGFWKSFRGQTTLLIDTYNPLRGAARAARMPGPVAAVRLDSGDLLAGARKVRAILDRAGRPEIRIMASGDLNEYRIEDLTRLGAPIDSFGVGTELITSLDAPALGGVYKLVEIVRDGRVIRTAKFSAHKATYPGRKQVYRHVHSRTGAFRSDWIAAADEPTPAAEPLLRCFMRRGRLLQPLPPLEASRTLCRQQLDRLPPRFRRLVEAPQFPVRYSPRLRQLRDRSRHRAR